MSPRIGELFAGYGGLGRGVQSVYGGEVAWVSDIDPGANKILAHRFPDVPNLGDITTVDWSTVEPVDILTGGFPCQDVSAAGKRAGIRPGTRSGLWSQFAYAISQLRPRTVVIENVRGLLSARAHSDVEPCAWCVGDDTDGALRALGAVLGDLAGLGYDASWHGLRAADVGAPHGRFRVFVVATDAERGGRNGRALDALRRPIPRVAAAGSGEEARPDLTLLPTPAVNDMGAGKTPEAWDEWTADMQARHSNGNGHGKSLAIEAQRLLPTPRSTQPGYADDGRGGKSLDVEARLLPTPSTQLAHGSQTHRSGARTDELLLDGIAAADRWGDYAAAIARWEPALGRPAPVPTMTSKKGTPQLSPAFVEWMMGLPAGWVTDVPGITRNEALKALGNGVVPQQAAAALAEMATWAVVA